MSNEAMQEKYEDHLAECHNRLAAVERERDMLKTALQKVLSEAGSHTVSLNTYDIANPKGFALIYKIAEAALREAVEGE